MKQHLASVLLVLAVDWASASHSDLEYSNIWEAEISGGEETAKRVARDLGYTYHGKLKSFDNRYVVTKDDIPEQSKYKSDHVTKELQDLGEVSWARQHIVPRRMEGPEASSYLRRLCSVIDPPTNTGASTVSDHQGDGSSNRYPIRRRPQGNSATSLSWDNNSKPYSKPPSRTSSGNTVTTTYSSNGDTSETYVSSSPSLKRPPFRFPIGFTYKPKPDDDDDNN